MREKRNNYRVLMKKPEGKRPLGKNLHVGGSDNNKMDNLYGKHPVVCHTVALIGSSTQQ
jgi:hypothetical protein